VVVAAARVAETRRGVAPELCLDDLALERVAAGAVPEGWRGAALGLDFAGFVTGSRAVALPGVWIP
jgi:hypothetical protein